MPPGSSEHSRAIAELAPQGFTAPQIAERLGIKCARVQRLARRDGVTLPGAGGRACRIAVPVPTAQLPALDAIATGAAVTRAEIIRRLVLAALDSGGKPAVRLLGKSARPKRTYRSREVREAQEAAQAVAEAARAAEVARSAPPWPEWLRAAVAAGQHPLRAVRLHLGLRLVDVEAAAGVSQNRVGAIERGAIPFTPRMRARLAPALGVEPGWLDPGRAGDQDPREALVAA